MTPIPSNRITRGIDAQTRISSEISRTQSQISSGKLFAKRSEAPVAADRVSQIDRRASDIRSWQSNIATGLARNAQADTVMRSVSDGLSRARELLVTGSNGALNASDRATLAAEVASIGQNVAALAATKDLDGSPLFPAGNGLAIRFGDQDVFAPVPGLGAAFGNGAIAAALADAEAALASGAPAALNGALAAVSSAIDLAANSAADIGLRGARMEKIGERLTIDDLDARIERSGLADADLSTAIASLNQQMLTLDSARAAFARINRETLFDILR